MSSVAGRGLFLIYSSKISVPMKPRMGNRCRSATAIIDVIRHRRRGPAAEELIWSRRPYYTMMSSKNIDSWLLLSSLRINFFSVFQSVKLARRPFRSNMSFILYRRWLYMYEAWDYLNKLFTCILKSCCINHEKKIIIYIFYYGPRMRDYVWRKLLYLKVQ